MHPWATGQASPLVLGEFWVWVKFDPYLIQVMSASMGFVKVDVYEPRSVNVFEGRLQHLLHVDSSSSEAAASPDAEAASPSAVRYTIGPAATLPRRQLLCNLRSILRKMGKHVLVGGYGST